MKYFIKAAILSILSVATLGVQTAYAGCTRVSAASCFVNETVNPKSVIRIGGYVGHRGNYTNMIQLRCPLNLENTRFQYVNFLRMYSEDNIAAPEDRLPGTQPNIIAQIRYMNLYGRIYTFARVDSFDNLLPTRGGEKNAYYASTKILPSGKYMDFSEASATSFDPKNVTTRGNFYFIDVYIRRPDLNMKPKFSGVSFCGDTFT